MKHTTETKLMCMSGIIMIALASFFLVQTYYGYSSFYEEYNNGDSGNNYSGIMGCVSNASAYVLCSSPPIIVAYIFGISFVVISYRVKNY